MAERLASPLLLLGLALLQIGCSMHCFSDRDCGQGLLCLPDGDHFECDLGCEPESPNCPAGEVCAESRVLGFPAPGYCIPRPCGNSPEVCLEHQTCWPPPFEGRYSKCLDWISCGDNPRDVATCDAGECDEHTVCDVVSVQRPGGGADLVCGCVPR